MQPRHYKLNALLCGKLVCLDIFISSIPCSETNILTSHVTYTCVQAKHIDIDMMCLIFNISKTIVLNPLLEAWLSYSMLFTTRGVL